MTGTAPAAGYAITESDPSSDKNATQGGDAKLLGISLLLKLPAIMAAAESYLEINETNIQNENYNISLDTTIKADNTTANSATAT